MPCGREGRDRGRASTSRRTPRMASGRQKLDRSLQEGLPRASEDPARGPLDLRLAASRAARRCSSVVKATQMVVLCYGSFRAYIGPLKNPGQSPCVIQISNSMSHQQVFHQVFPFPTSPVPRTDLNSPAYSKPPELFTSSIYEPIISFQISL